MFQNTWENFDAKILLLVRISTHFHTLKIIPMIQFTSLSPPEWFIWVPISLVISAERYKVISAQVVDLRKSWSLIHPMGEKFLGTHLVQSGYQRLPLTYTTKEAVLAVWFGSSVLCRDCFLVLFNSVSKKCKHIDI